MLLFLFFLYLFHRYKTNTILYGNKVAVLQPKCYLDVQFYIPLDLAGMAAVEALVASGHHNHLAQDQRVDTLLVPGS